MDFSGILAKLRSLTQFDLQPHWRYCPEDLAIAHTLDPQLNQNWPAVTLTATGQITWEAGTPLWLAQTWTVPTHLQGFPLEGYSLRWSLLWWAETVQVFVNGELVQTGDLFDCAPRLCLTTAVTPGMEFNLALRLVSPRHDPGAVVRSLALFEGQPGVDPGMIADELECLAIAGKPDPEFLTALTATVAAIDWSEVSSREGFERQLQALGDRLLSLPLPPRAQVFLLGHAHLDLAWLWTITETWAVAQRTFSSVLQLQQEYPELTFGHSTPALYAWLETHRPDLWAAIHQQVHRGKWEIIAGFWVEPELNLVSGESIIRQVLYGQRYVQQHFQVLNRVAWLPDTFGFCWQLPQILKLGKIDYFVTQKLRWNDTTVFPYEVFWWQGLDGTQVLSLMSAPLGQGIEPVQLARYAQQWQEHTGRADALWLPGIGDHGGGPTRDMLEVGRRSQLSPFLPQLKFTTAHAYLDRLAQGEGYPVWQDELYLEFHRGCYTTHGVQKAYNRRCEQLLYQAELWSTCATLLGGFSYPHLALETAWQSVLLNQFHDILPGSAIGAVFAEANQAWEGVIEVTQSIIAAAFRAIASQVTLPEFSTSAQPILVFNSLNWSRSEMVSVPWPDPRVSGSIYTVAGEKLTTQVHRQHLFFLAADIPAIGYRLFWLVPGNEPPVSPSFPEAFVLENATMRIEIDPETGDIRQWCDRLHHPEILNGLGNQLQSFQDQGQYWDAWNIDPHYLHHPLPPTQLRQITWTTYGELLQEIQVIRQLGNSEFTQYYTLFADKNQLKITTHVHWRERHTLVKVSFPLTLHSSYLTQEIPCGSIRRPTLFTNDQERARWEVPALTWSDLTDESQNYGVSIFSDYKSGYDPQPNQLRLTLLRGSTWPDPDADLGEHHFSYVLYPHQGNWQSAGIVQRAREFSFPLQIYQLPTSEFTSPGTLPDRISLLHLSPSSLILTAFKPTENDPNSWILRCYESEGKTALLETANHWGLTISDRLNLLEEPLSENSLEIRPWEIVTIHLRDFLIKP